MLTAAITTALDISCIVRAFREPAAAGEVRRMLNGRPRAAERVRNGGRA